jgi:glucose/arabinose dehydrogenase
VALRLAQTASRATALGRAFAGLALAAPLALSSARAQTLADPTLVLETVVASGLTWPTTMAFVGPDDFLVLEKNVGQVRRVQGGVLAPTPVLTLPVESTSERGLLGIAVNSESPPRVFLYFTEADGEGNPLANRVYRYDWNAGAGALENPLLVLDLPVTPGPNHNAGVLALGPPGEVPGVGDGALLYVAIGDLNRMGQLQNNFGGPPPDDSGVVLRVRQDGTPAPGNPFTPYCSTTTTQSCTSDAGCPGGQTCRLQVARYFAYGVRNSFGLALDPASGSLWDTENGPESYDEVNRLAPGTNSGWRPIMGPDARDSGDPSMLFNMPGAGSTYSDPEFSWLVPIAPTAILFPFGSSLGPVYDDVALVADANLGQLYAFPLDGARSAFDVSGFGAGLADLVADSPGERDEPRIGEGFGSISDLEIGPDGHLYVLAIFPGRIYRVIGTAEVPALPAWGAVVLAALLGAGVVLFARATQNGSKA